jgi:hypothetical protein
MLALGIGAGGGIALTIAVASEFEIDAAEINPKVVEVTVKFFGLPVDRKNSYILVADRVHRRSCASGGNDVADVPHAPAIVADLFIDSWSGTSQGVP